MKKYDLVLAFSQFREVNQYPNLVKYLAKDFTIAIYELPDSSVSESVFKARKKTKNTNRAVLDICRSLGADTISDGEIFNCKLLIIPQSYSFAQKPIVGLNFEKAAAIERFGSGPRGLERLSELGVSIFFTYEKRMFNRLANAFPEFSIPKDIRIIEMGAVYKKYPLFDFSDLDIDYIIALPTSMFIRNLDDRIRLYSRMHEVLNSLGRRDKVVIKNHNVADVQSKEIFLDRFFRHIACIPWIKNHDSLLSLSNKLHKKIGYALLRADEGIIFGKIKRHSTPLDRLTIYANIGIEHYLPFVKKGVITGISSCQWHALYNRLPVYNCDNRTVNSKMPNSEIYGCFLSPPCKGGKNVQTEWFDIMDDSCRNADMIELIRSELL